MSGAEPFWWTESWMPPNNPIDSHPDIRKAVDDLRQLNAEMNVCLRRLFDPIG